jgi:hypothetical protein
MSGFPYSDFETSTPKSALSPSALVIRPKGIRSNFTEPDLRTHRSARSDTIDSVLTLSERRTINEKDAVRPGGSSFRIVGATTKLRLRIGINHSSSACVSSVGCSAETEIHPRPAPRTSLRSTLRAGRTDAHNPCHRSAQACSNVSWCPGMYNLPWSIVASRLK